MIYIGAFLLISIVWYLLNKNRKRNSQSKPPLIQEEEEGNTKQEKRIFINSLFYFVLKMAKK